MQIYNTQTINFFVTKSNTYYLVTIYYINYRIRSNYIYIIFFDVQLVHYLIQ